MAEGEMINMMIRTITRNIQRIEDKMFKSFLSRTDFERKLCELKDADRSSRPSVIRDLIEMFKYVDNIDCLEDMDDNYYEYLIRHTKFPLNTDTDVEYKIIDVLYENFGNYPKPEDYMLRIVNRCSIKEDGWEKDSLRLRILKQFIKYGGYLSYKRDVDDKNGKTKKETVSICGGATVIKKYVEYKLEKIGNEQKNVNDNTVIKNLDDNIFVEYFDIIAKEQKKLGNLQSEYNKYKLAEKNIQENIKKITKTIKDADDNYKELSNIFGKYGLIKLANDLAVGKFKSGDDTEKNSYLFAMIFYATYYPENEKNCRSFAKMIYIFFMSKNYSLSEKKRKSNEMIERVKKIVEETCYQSTKSKRAQQFKNFFIEDILAKSEEEFEEFIIKEYDCSALFKTKKNASDKSEEMTDDIDAGIRKLYANIKRITYEVADVTKKKQKVCDDKNSLWMHTDECSTSEEIVQTIEKGVEKLFTDYPNPEDYMLKLESISSIKENGWKSDSLRLRILKQFVKYGDYLSYKRDVNDKNGKEKKEIVKICGGETTIKKYIKDKLEKKGKMTKTINKNMVIENLDESIFLDIDTINEKKKELNNLRREYSKYRVTEENILDCTKELKKSIEAADNRCKDLRDISGKYGLIKLADDLATGKFKSGGATRRDLYLFAMVFNMTYYSGKNSKFNNTTEIIDYDTDVEINLFRDYYNNNLMRFITEAYSGKLNAYELDPSGNGINYKNFAEMIYIYFISKDYSVSEKICKSNEMIERVKRKAEGRGYTEKETPQTKYFKNLFTEDILDKSEEEFEEFIIENYDCNVLFKTKNGTLIKRSVMQINVGQRTAWDIYKELVEARETYGVSNDNYGLWMHADEYPDGEEIAEIIERKITDPKKRTKQGTIEFEKFASFAELLKAINLFLKSTNEVTSAEQITRTKIIAAFYYCYNAKNEKIGKAKSFAEVYSNYCAELNDMLEDAGYQPINSKSIFDMAVIFSSYAYVKELEDN